MFPILSDVSKHHKRESFYQLKTGEAPHHTWVAVCIVASNMRKVDEPGFLQIIDDSYFLSCHKTKHSKKALSVESFSLLKIGKALWFLCYGGRTRVWRRLMFPISSDTTIQDASNQRGKALLKSFNIVTFLMKDIIQATRLFLSYIFLKKYMKTNDKS